MILKCITAAQLYLYTFQPITSVMRPTTKRRPHHDLRREDGQPSYMNVDYGNNHNDTDSDSNYESVPSYMNCDFDKKTKKRSGKRRSGKANPSYMNMAYHNKRENERMRRRKDEYGDLVELDFTKKPENEQKQEKYIDGPVEVYVTREDSEEKSDKPINSGEPIDDLNEGPASEAHMEDDSDMFLPIGDYSKDSDIEVNLQEGKSVQVLQQNDGGWWLVRTQSLSIGWAPSNFLEKITPKELQKRKELGLETPQLPPLRPPKSNRVHKKGLEICHERKFWSFVRKNGKEAATCSIIDDDVNINYFGDDGKPLDKDNPGEDKSIVCDDTGACFMQTNTKL